MKTLPKEIRQRINASSKAALEPSGFFSELEDDDNKSEKQEVMPEAVLIETKSPRQELERRDPEQETAYYEAFYLACQQEEPFHHLYQQFATLRDSGDTVQELKIRPENDHDNIEYKIKMGSIPRSIFEGRLTQMKYRIKLGNGCAFYHIGV